MNRRDAIQAAAATAAMMMFADGYAASAPAETEAAQSLRILILGGTGFIGPHQVAALRARGHKITLFNRGKQAPTPFKDIETLIGDRNGDLEALKGRDWDAVIDNSGFTSTQARLTAELLAGHTQRYLFVSTELVYADTAVPGIDENYPLLQIASADEASAQSYGGSKALCEQVVEATFGDRATVLRPSLIVGPRDTQDFFTYWPVRVARGGHMLAPGTRRDLIQFIDVRDLADFMCLCVEQQIGGRYNVCSPPGMFTMGELLQTSQSVSKSRVKTTWASPEFLTQHGLIHTRQIPLWSSATGTRAGAGLLSSVRAVARGLRFRPLETTVRDVLAWHRKRPASERQQLQAGLSAERETQLLRELSSS